MSFMSNLNFSNLGDNPNQYLLFKVGDDNFCVKVDLVNQIEFYQKHYPVPSSPYYVLGVVKTLGKIVTLVHLGRRLRINDRPIKKNMSQIIYIEKSDGKTIGMVVDEVKTLENIPKNQIKEDLDVINTDIPLDFLSGTVTLDNHGIVIILNLDLVLSNFETEDIDVDKEFDDKRSRLTMDELKKHDLAESNDLLYSTEIESEEDDLFDSIPELNLDEEDLYVEEEPSTEEDSSTTQEDIPKTEINKKKPLDEEESDDGDEFFDDSLDEEDDFV